jgi:pimeloyl-ACP methyl ester carboxylesterase
MLIRSDLQLKTVRVGVWINVHLGLYVVGFRATGIGATGAVQDLKDDKVVAGMVEGTATCDIHIAREGKAVLSRLIQVHGVPPSRIMVAGYSLGGTAALCVGTLFPGVTVVSFFGGAPPTNPILNGPGPSRATHYHVVGDLVSSHVSNRAARVVRVDKGYTDFSVLGPHLSGRFLRNDYTARPATADQEDDLLVRWAVGDQQPTGRSWVGKAVRWGLSKVLPTVVTGVMGGTKSLIDRAAHAYYAKVACRSPIPDSTRFKVGTSCGMTYGAQLCQRTQTLPACNTVTVVEMEEE